MCATPKKPNNVFACAYTKTWQNEDKQPINKNILQVVNVPRYSLEEMKTIVDYYQSVYYIYADSNGFIDSLTYMTGALGGKIFHEMEMM